MRHYVWLLLAVAACATSHSPETLDVDVGSVSEALSLPLGGHLPGIDDTDFAEVAEVFAAVEDVGDGVGPVFNHNSCGACHVSGALGGAGTHVVTRFGTYNGSFDPLAQMGGSLRQSDTLGNWVNPQGVQCSVPLENVPGEATITARRLTTPLFGLGLVDAMPDQFFVHVAKRQHPAVRGKVNWVSVELPDLHDPNQSVGSQRVGRFGWKAGVPNLTQFSADAYVNEMGITTQSCVKGQSVEAFAAEPTVNGVVIPAECEDGKPGVDDAVGPCDGNLSEIQEDVDEFNEFMTFLAPPSRKRVQGKGSSLFETVGCADCHLSRPFKTPSHPHNGVPGNYVFYPYSDFLRHDMGSLGDRIGNAGDSYETTRLMRTAPLWGIRYRELLLHDGRTADIGEAIKAHDGQAASAANRFSRLCAGDKQALIKYVKSL